MIGPSYGNNLTSTGVWTGSALNEGKLSGLGAYPLTAVANDQTDLDLTALPGVGGIHALVVLTTEANAAGLRIGFSTSGAAPALTSNVTAYQFLTDIVFGQGKHALFVHADKITDFAVYNPHASTTQDLLIYPYGYLS